MLGDALISVARSLSKFQQDQSTRERLLSSKTTYVDSRTNSSTIFLSKGVKRVHTSREEDINGVLIQKTGGLSDILKTAQHHKQNMRSSSGYGKER